MNKIVLSIKRAFIVTIGIQFLSWLNDYFDTGVIDQFESIFNEENVILSLKIFIAIFVIYYILILYFASEKK